MFRAQLTLCVGESYVTMQLDFGQSVSNLVGARFPAIIKLYCTYVKDNEYQALKKTKNY